MAEKNATLIISGATALYPRINQTYKFVKNGTKQERVACDPLDDGAEYTMSLALTKAEASSVYKAMKAEYAKKKQDKWDEFPASSEVFELNDNGEYVIRTKLKGAFNKEVTRVDQFDASNNELPKDFLLTTGSKINVLVSLVVYDPSRMDGCGVSLRLRQVQVIDLAEMKKRSAFEVMEGGFNSQSEGFATGFADAADTEGEEIDEFDEPAPKKSKPAAKAEPKKETKSVEDYNDIDSALDDLDFEDA